MLLGFAEHLQCQWAENCGHDCNTISECNVFPLLPSSSLSSSVLEVGWCETDGMPYQHFPGRYKSYQHFHPEKYHTGMPHTPSPSALSARRSSDHTEFWPASSHPQQLRVYCNVIESCWWNSRGIRASYSQGSQYTAIIIIIIAVPSFLNVYIFSSFEHSASAVQSNVMYNAIYLPTLAPDNHNSLSYIQCDQITNCLLLNTHTHVHTTDRRTDVSDQCPASHSDQSPASHSDQCPASHSDQCPASHSDQCPASHSELACKNSLHWVLMSTKLFHAVQRTSRFEPANLQFIERVIQHYVFCAAIGVCDTTLHLSLIHIWRCRRSTLCRSRWSPYH